MVQRKDWLVSINSTSDKRSDDELDQETQENLASLFPLIPLPIKEAIPQVLLEAQKLRGFPLIPLPIKEAIWGKCFQGRLKCLSLRFH